MMLSLQVCQACGAVQYPAHGVCGSCLCGDLALEEVAPGGTVLSWTRGHLSALPSFKDQMPMVIARIQLDAGPIVLAICAAAPAIGARLSLSQNQAGTFQAG